MGFFDIFKSKNDKARLNHLKNLLCVAMADGKLEQSELAAISSVISREGMNPNELERIVKNPNTIDFVVPEKDSDKIRFLKDLVMLMMVDGNIDDNEMEVCKLAALSYGYRPEVVGTLILDIIKEITQNI